MVKIFTIIAFRITLKNKINFVEKQCYIYFLNFYSKKVPTIEKYQKILLMLMIRTEFMTQNMITEIQNK